MSARPAHPSEAWEVGAVGRAAHEVHKSVPLSANPYVLVWQRRDWERGWRYEDEQIEAEKAKAS